MDLPCRSRGANQMCTECCLEVTVLPRLSNVSWAVWGSSLVLQHTVGSALANPISTILAPNPHAAIISTALRTKSSPAPPPRSGTSPRVPSVHPNQP